MFFSREHMFQNKRDESLTFDHKIWYTRQMRIALIIRSVTLSACMNTANNIP